MFLKTHHQILANHFEKLFYKYITLPPPMAPQPRRALAYQATAAQPEGLQITRCRVVSTTNRHGRYSWLSRQGMYFPSAPVTMNH